MCFPIFAQNVTIRDPFAIPVMRRCRNALKPLLLVVHLRFRKKRIFMILDPAEGAKTTVN